MIIKMQSVIFPYVRQKEIKKASTLRKSDRVMADRIMMAILFGVVIVAAILFT
jgi:hypothetical protein